MGSSKLFYLVLVIDVRCSISAECISLAQELHHPHRHLYVFLASMIQVSLHSTSHALYARQIQQASLTGLAIRLVSNDQDCRGIKGLLKVLSQAVQIIVSLIQPLIAAPESICTPFWADSTSILSHIC